MNKQRTKNEQGVILVFTLILLGVLLAVAMGFFYFVLLDLKKARAIDNSTVAYYAADAGIERSLYIIKKQEAVQSTSALIDLYKAASELPNGIFVLGNQAQWDINDSTDQEKNFFRQRLANGDNVKLYFLDRDSHSDKPKSFSIQWYKGKSGSIRSDNMKLQVAINQLNPQKYTGGGTSNAVVYFAEDNKIETDDLLDNSNIKEHCYAFKNCDVNGPEEGDECTPLGYFVNYVVELKALGELESDFIDRLSVTTYDDEACNTVSSYGVTNLTLKSRGVFNNNQQIIIAHIPPLDPLSGLFGFVLFSEKDITKE